MIAKVMKVESGIRYEDKQRRITFKVEGAENWDAFLTFSEEFLKNEGIRTTHLDQEFRLSIREVTP